MGVLDSVVGLHQFPSLHLLKWGLPRRERTPTPPRPRPRNPQAPPPPGLPRQKDASPGSDSSHSSGRLGHCSGRQGHPGFTSASPCGSQPPDQPSPNIWWQATASRGARSRSTPTPRSPASSWSRIAAQRTL